MRRAGTLKQHLAWTLLNWTSLFFLILKSNKLTSTQLRPAKQADTIAIQHYSTDKRWFSSFCGKAFYLAHVHNHTGIIALSQHADPLPLFTIPFYCSLLIGAGVVTFSSSIFRLVTQQRLQSLYHSLHDHSMAHVTKPIKCCCIINRGGYSHIKANGDVPL